MGSNPGREIIFHFLSSAANKATEQATKQEQQQQQQQQRNNSILKVSVECGVWGFPHLF
jgi:hypothetical protein